MPHLIVNTAPILRNAAVFRGLAEKNSLDLVVVTKFCQSDPLIVGALANGGFLSIADSNLSSLRALASAGWGQSRGKLRKSLLKTRLSDLRTMASLPPGARPDRVFVTDRAMLEALRGLEPGSRPDILLIAEVGDLKEGFPPEELVRAARDFADLPISGVSANYACLTGRMPDSESLEGAAELARRVAAARGLGKPFVSLGGTVVYDFLAEGSLRGLAAEVRIGEGIFFGYDTSGGRALPGLEGSAFTFRGEIMELREKYVAETAQAGHNALGQLRAAGKAGSRRRAVLDFGILACDASDAEPLDPDAAIAGQTFDYTVADLSDSGLSYAPGGFVDFRLRYPGASRAFMNRHVDISLVKGLAK